MRWSSTLTLFAIEFLAISLPAIHALPLPEDFDLVARNPGKGKGKGKQLKKSSSNYRDAARQNPTSFDLVGDGHLTQFQHTSPHTPQKGQHADHALEAQTVHAALNSIGQPFGTLPTPVRHDVREEFNGPGNMILVPGTTNMDKGHLTTKALKGPLPETPQRADHQIYLPVGHQAASQTAPKVDNALKKGNIPGAEDSPVRKHEEKVQRNMHPNSSHQSSSDTPHTPPQDSPQSSHHGSPHGSP